MFFQDNNFMLPNQDSTTETLYLSFVWKRSWYLHDMVIDHIRKPMFQDPCLNVVIFVIHSFQFLLVIAE